MDKKSLNNEIVKMRPEALKARVHTISKLNREVKRIRNLKNFRSDSHKQKLLQKADRHVEELLLMKKLRHDEISKFALSHSKKSATAILSDPNSSLESKCLSKLALHAGLMTRVDTFRAQFPNWETTLVALLDSIGVKEKRSKVLAKSLKLLKKSKVQEDEEMGNSSDESKNEEESITQQVVGDDDSDLEEEIETNSDNEIQSDMDSSDELEADSDTISLNNGVRKCKQTRPIVKNKSSKSTKVSRNVSFEKMSKEQFKPYDDHESSEKSKNDEHKPSVKLAKKLPDPKLKNKKLKNNIVKEESGAENPLVPELQSKKLKNNKNVKDKSGAKKLLVPKLKNKKIKNNNIENDESGAENPLVSELKNKKLKNNKNVNNNIGDKKKSSQDISNSDSCVSKKKIKHNVTVNRSREMKVMRFTELLGSNKSTETVTESNDEPSATLSTKTVDSFFVAGDGMSDFLSTVVVKEPTVQQKPVDRVPQEVYDSSGRRLNRREIRSRLHGNKGFNTFPSRPYQNKARSDMWSQPVKLMTSKWKKDSTAPSQTKVFLPPVEEVLHPSWEAKKKQKEQFNTVFQGKKIKFDD